MRHARLCPEPDPVRLDATDPYRSRWHCPGCMAEVTVIAAGNHCLDCLALIGDHQTRCATCAQNTPTGRGAR